MAHRFFLVVLLSMLAGCATTRTAYHKEMEASIAKADQFISQLQPKKS